MGEQLCLPNGSPEGTRRVVEYLEAVDAGINWRKNFRSYGAAHPDKINVAEMQQHLGWSTEAERESIAVAVLEIFKFAAQEYDDRYCLESKFETENMSKFTQWDEVWVVSRKMASNHEEKEPASANAEPTDAETKEGKTEM